MENELSYYGCSLCKTKWGSKLPQKLQCWKCGGEAKKLKLFEIWSEGYAATGDRGYATEHGEEWGIDFRDACERFFSDKKNDPEGCFDPKNLGYWGCGLYDNEKSARKHFG